MATDHGSRVRFLGGARISSVRGSTPGPYPGCHGSSPWGSTVDEPTVGLDPHVRRNLWDIIKGLKDQGFTVLLTTHYLDEAEKLSDRVCILDKGKIQLIGTPDKLMEDFKQTNLEDMFIELLKAGENE